MHGPGFNMEPFKQNLWISRVFDQSPGIHTTAVALRQETAIDCDKANDKRAISAAASSTPSESQRERKRVADKVNTIGDRGARLASTIPAIKTKKIGLTTVSNQYSNNSIRLTLVAASSSAIAAGEGDIAHKAAGMTVCVMCHVFAKVKTTNQSEVK